MVEVNQEKLQAKIEDNQEKVEAVAEHYKWVSHITAMHHLSAPEDKASNVLHGVLKEATYEDTIRALEDQFGGQHVPLKTRIQFAGESLQEVAIDIEQMAFCTLPALHKRYFHREAGMALVDSIR
jgi:hypothetical protein